MEEWHPPSGEIVTVIDRVLRLLQKLSKHFLGLFAFILILLEKAR